MNRRRLLRRLRAGSRANVRFADLLDLATALGFHEVRSGGSHRIFQHPAIPESLNLQPRHGEAQPYQIRQLIDLVERYDLSLEAE